MQAKQKILVVEDEALVALDVADYLDDLGFAVVGPALNLDHAIDLARHADIDGAVLDLVLGEERCYPVAEILLDRGVPFGFATGLLPAAIKGGFNPYPILSKPFQRDDLATFLNRVLHMRKSIPLAPSSPKE